MGLEDTLNDLAVIRTTLETIDVFPDDAALREELMGIIEDARGNLLHRLEGLRESASGLDEAGLEEFKELMLQMARKGAPRSTIDSLIGLGGFETERKEGEIEPVYRYEFLPRHAPHRIADLAPPEFLRRVIEDLHDTAAEPRHYTGKSTFDLGVFRKFVAVLFAIYATTDFLF